MQPIYDLYNLVGKNLQQIRKEHKESQEKLAEDIGMSRGFISRIECPKVEVGVSLDTLFAVATKYNIDIREFFNGYEKFIKDEKDL